MRKAIGFDEGVRHNTCGSGASNAAGYAMIVGRGGLVASTSSTNFRGTSGFATGGGVISSISSAGSSGGSKTTYTR